MPTPPVSWNSKGDTLTATTAATSSASAAMVASATAVGGSARALEAFADKGHAVHAEASGSHAYGVYGLSGHTVGVGVGVYGRSDGASGSGVYGRQTGSLGYGVRAYQTGSRGIGVYATQTGSAGRGVYGYASNTGSTSTLWAAGVYGKARSTYSVGVYGENSAYNGKAIVGEHKGASGNGVFGKAGDESDAIWGYAVGTRNCTGVYGKADATRDWALGVAGIGTSTGGRARGVFGAAESDDGDAIGVYGTAFATPASKSSTFAGVQGQVSSTRGYGVYSKGDFGGTGAKYFIQPHPTDPAVSVQFICLEGNESGTYFRGKTKLVDGRAAIPIPEEWRLVTEAEGITVQTTPIRAASVLYVAEQSRDRIVIKGTRDCEFAYFVNGIRRGFVEYEPYLPNSGFRPEVRGVPFGTQYPKALRDVLVKNGTLNPDYTPNEATAARLGWKLNEPDAIRVERRWWLPAEERQRLMKATTRRPREGSERSSPARVGERR